MIKVLLADDQPIVRQGLRMRLALEEDLVVVGEAGDGIEAITLAETLCPHVVVMDVKMPVVDGITATRLLRASNPCVAVVILSLRGNAITKSRAKEAGAAAFVEKEEPVETLLAAIRSAAG